MTMLEKVAKALYEHGYVGDWPPTREVDLNMDANYFRALARAAIQAMREPNDTMLLAALKMGEPEDRVVWTKAKSVWHDMIDAALNETPLDKP